MNHAFTILAMGSALAVGCRDVEPPASSTLTRATTATEQSPHEVDLAAVAVLRRELVVDTPEELAAMLGEVCALAKDAVSRRSFRELSQVPWEHALVATERLGATGQASHLPVLERSYRCWSGLNPGVFMAAKNPRQALIEQTLWAGLQAKGHDVTGATALELFRRHYPDLLRSSSWLAGAYTLLFARELRREGWTKDSTALLGDPDVAIRRLLVQHVVDPSVPDAVRTALFGRLADEDDVVRMVAAARINMLAGRETVPGPWTALRNEGVGHGLMPPVRGGNTATDLNAHAAP